MATDVIRQDRIVTDLKRAAPMAPLANAADVAKEAWTQALKGCADRMGLEGFKAAADQVRQGNHTARLHCCHVLAERMAASLRSSYPGIQAIYAPDCDNCPQDFCPDQAVITAPLVHLLIWTDQKTPAIGLRAAALGNALARVGYDLIGAQERPNLLQVQVIDDRALENLLGSGCREKWSTRLQAHLLSMNEPTVKV